LLSFLSIHFSSNHASYSAASYNNSSTSAPFNSQPKTRPPNAMPQRYASLPCSSPPKLQDFSGSNDTAGGSLDGGRNKLGIGISAVHDAVLRGMARLPDQFSFPPLHLAEPILNEHPVTIYPGRASPTRRMPPRTLSGSMERHRFPTSDNSTSTSQENSSPENNESEYNESSLSPTHGHLQPLQGGGTPVNSLLSRIFHQSAAAPPPPPISSTASGTRSHRIPPPAAGVIIPTRTSRRPGDSDDERFSDDSLEESSLPPPPGPPTVPPPPSLSAPVTPSKRHSIAWEVNLDDPASFGDPLITTPKSSTAISS
uniref:Uncharacterized protein n=1 Tax=Anopheles christyi TaxID=43041 RepID=A0A182KC20_9DIPT